MILISTLRPVKRFICYSLSSFYLLLLFTCSANSQEGTMSFVSKFVQMEESKGAERYFWNRVRYEKMIDVGTSCYAEGAYELIPFWLEDGLRLRDRVSMSSPESRIYRAVDLQHRISRNTEPSSAEEVVVEHDLDRLFLSCSIGQWELLMGRQAVSFGAAFSVNPTDLFMPVAFKPQDGEFRSGSDALRIRSWLSDTSELDFGMLAGFAENPGNNGAFLRLHMLLGETDLIPVLASFGRNRLAGLSLQSSLGNWGVVFDGAWIETGETKTLLPVDQETHWLPWTIGINRQLSADLFGSLEYHRNPMGTKNPEAYEVHRLQPIYENYPVSLMGQDYLMTSLQFQINPLWSFSFSSMHNGNDGSSLILPELDWNLAEDWWINFAGSYSIGKRKRGKSEFGAASDLFSLSLRHYR